MDILTIKEVSSMWGISVRRITVLCNEGRIAGAKKLQVLSFCPNMQRNLLMRELNQGNTQIGEIKQI